MVIESASEAFEAKYQKSEFLIPILILTDIIILASIAFLPPIVAIASFLAFVLSIFFLISPLGYIYFIIIWMPYESLILPDGASIRILRLITIFLILAVAWTKFALSSKKLSFPPKKIFLPLIMFFLWTGLTVLSSPAPINSLFAFVKLVGFFLIFIITYNMINSRDDLKKVLYFYVISAIPIFAVGFYQFFVLHILRTASILGNPNTLGIYSITISAVIILAYSLSSKSLLQKTMFGILYVFAFMTLIISGSRGSALGYLVFTITYLFIKKNYKVIFIMLATIAISIFYVLRSEYLTFALAKSLRLFSGTTGRTIIWDAGLRMIRDHLILGVGPGGVSKLLYTYAQATHPIVGLELHAVIEKGMIHNGYLQWLAELGIPGLILIFWADVSFIKYLARKIIFSISSNQKTLAIVAIALFMAGVFHSIVESSMDIGPFSSEIGIFIIYVSILKILNAEHSQI